MPLQGVGEDTHNQAQEVDRKTTTEEPSRLSTSDVHCRLRAPDVQASSMAAQDDREFGCVLLDFSKAYDRVPHERVLVKLSGFDGMTKELVIAVAHWLTERTFYYDADGLFERTHDVR